MAQLSERLFALEQPLEQVTQGEDRPYERPGGHEGFANGARGVPQHGGCPPARAQTNDAEHGAEQRRGRCYSAHGDLRITEMGCPRESGMRQVSCAARLIFGYRVYARR